MVRLIKVVIKNMPYKEKQIEKLHWTIGDLAKELNVETSVIRYWEDVIPMLKPKRKKGRRVYNRHERDMIHTIHKLRIVNESHTIKGVVQYLENL